MTKFSQKNNNFTEDEWIDELTKLDEAAELDELLEELASGEDEIEE